MGKKTSSRMSGNLYWRNRTGETPERFIGGRWEKKNPNGNRGTIKGKDGRRNSFPEGSGLSWEANSIRRGGKSGYGGLRGKAEDRIAIPRGG